VVPPVLDDYAGWAAFRAALQGPFRDPFPTRGEHVIGQILSALTNVVFIALFLYWVRGRMERPWMFTKVALVCLVLNLYWLVEMIRAGEPGALLVALHQLAAFALLRRRARPAPLQTVGIENTGRHAIRR
jgi:hypothetical protein